MIKVEVTRNYKGFPVAARLQDGNKIVTAEYEFDRGFTIKGSRRNLTPAVLELLRLIFPAPEAIKTIENITHITDIDTIGEITVANVKTTGGDNILIDLLKQSAWTPRTKNIGNDNGVTTPTAPPSNLSNTTYKSKFIPRAMRGFISSLGIYCKRTGAGTITLSYAPFPGMGAIGSVTVTPGADWDWKSATVYRMWNYDSMFVWVSACSADVSFGYDTSTPYDGWTSADSGVTWSLETRRYYIIAYMQGQTVGDVPVSGTINNIEIPSTVSAGQGLTINATHNTETLGTIRFGSGKLLVLYYFVNSAAALANIKPRLYLDGVSILPNDITLDLWHDYIVGDSKEGIFFSRYDSTGNLYTFMLTVKYSFKRSFQVGVFNTHAANDYVVGVGFGYEKIS